MPAVRPNINPSALARITHIHRQLQTDQRPNCTTLAKQLEVAAKTIQRDISFMRDQLSLPIEWAAPYNGYIYTEPVTGLPSIQVSEGEILALFVAQQALTPYTGTPYEAPLKSAFQKLAESMGDLITISLDDLQETVTFRAVGKGIINPTVFADVQRGLNDHLTLLFAYHKLEADEPETRKVQPLHLACIDHQWYLFAWDLSREDIRTFCLSRIRSEVQHGPVFDPPIDFDLKEHLKTAFLVSRGEGHYHCHLRFTGIAARIVKERTWSDDQEMEELPNGEVDLQLELTSLRDFTPWVLSWGDEVRVLEPEELRDSVREKLRATGALYDQMERDERKDYPLFCRAKMVPRELASRAPSAIVDHDVLRKVSEVIPARPLASFESPELDIPVEEQDWYKELLDNVNYHTRQRRFDIFLNQFTPTDDPNQLQLRF